MNHTLGKWLYGLAFCVAAPALLVGWAHGAAVHFAPLALGFHWRVAGAVLAGSGTALMLKAMADLWLTGKGLPMNAYPPQHYVRSGAYRLFRHPIYVGFVLICFGVSLGVSSAAGLFLVSPVAALGVMAIVLGYEQRALGEIFGTQAHAPLLGIAPQSAEPATMAQRIGAAVMVFFVWALLYELLIVAGPGKAVNSYLPVELRWPVIEWAVWPYASIYVLAIVVPLTLRSKAGLRRWTTTALWSIGLGVWLCLIVPLKADPRAFTPVSVSGVWLLWERQADGAAAAFPSFHVIWAVLSAAALAHEFRRLRRAAWLTAFVIAVSCVATGQHSLADVAAGILVAAAGLNYPHIIAALQRGSTRLANSWRSRRVGPARIISHSIWAALAASTGILLAGCFIADWRVLLLLTLCTLLGAGLWGWLMEGSPVLQRPFGYYGGILGGMAGAVVVSVWQQIPLLYLLAVFSLVAPWVQVLGRLRCMVQGCCHGAEKRGSGIVYTHPKTRVCAVSGLGGKTIHNTQLYSLVCNLVIGTVLLRLAYEGFPATLLTGLYFILNGLARFVEEHYRGEVQTAVRGGLRIYQWAALASVLAGVACSMWPSAITLHEAAAPGWPVWAVSLAAGCCAAFALGVDFPDSGARFSRLAGK
ncbi:MAG: prolipoprotein diacylglyceryl transferase [Bacteroidia bacterium]|nr:prolipoprotein diacylglyceryl transferase [Bacteroidia bacterium]